MNVKQLLKDHSLKKAALLLAEKRHQLKENPDDALFAQADVMTQMAYEVFHKDGHSLQTLYNYYYQKLNQLMPRPGETVLYYDPAGDDLTQARVIAATNWPKWVMIECNGQLIEVSDRDIYLQLYW